MNYGDVNSGISDIEDAMHQGGNQCFGEDEDLFEGDEEADFADNNFFILSTPPAPPLCEPHSGAQGLHRGPLR